MLSFNQLRKLWSHRIRKPETVTDALVPVAHANFGEAVALHQRGQLSAAQILYTDILKTQPTNADALHFLGLIALQTQSPLKAVELIDKAIAIAPDSAAAHANRGLALHDLKQLDSAVASYDKAIAIKPDYAEAYYNRGIALQALTQLDDAIASYDNAIAIKPDFAEAHSNRGNALKELKRFDAAIISYDRAIAIKPDSAEACYNRAVALAEYEQHEVAVASFDRAIAIRPDFADAYSNRGLSLEELKRFDAAVASYDRAIAIKPDFAECYSNRGNALKELKQLAAAVASYDQAIAIKPDFADAYSNRGVALQGLKQLDAAVASYDKAIAINSNYAEAYYNRGIVLSTLKQHQAALESYCKAIAIKPDLEFLLGARSRTKMEICDWSDADGQFAELIQKVQGGEKASQPFAVLAWSASLVLQRKIAETWVKAKCPSNFDLGNIPKRPRAKKIRLGYFSMDFCNHPVSFLTAELFELHDRDQFEVYAFSFGPDTKDEMRLRLEAAFDKFVDVKDKSDKEIASLARQMHIDIAIDLAGFTGDARTNIFAMRAAPVQVNYLGYPGTMGANYIDYLIADRQLIPEESRTHYAEEIVYLPCFQANDSKRKIADKVFSREELGLPETGFVFCCFNNTYKITPTTFEGWMRILKQVEGSVLWLLEDNPTAAENLRSQAQRRGMNPERLVFAKRVPLPEYLARYRTADLFLDTFPFNAGTTASDALWAGLPLMTCEGEAFASRMASSLLSAIDLPELVTTTQEEYEALAVELATHPEQLRAIRQKLEDNRLSTPLFDTKLFTRNIEQAYTWMLEH
jgi:predicted O-linked N-acetylglucosamine transferase (SPINDLY family)